MLSKTLQAQLMSTHDSIPKESHYVYKKDNIFFFPSYNRVRREKGQRDSKLD